MKSIALLFLGAVLANCAEGQSQEASAVVLEKPESLSGRLTLPSTEKSGKEDYPFEIPRPAHAANSVAPNSGVGFRVTSSRNPTPASPEGITPAAGYFLPDQHEKPAITPENANLNLPKDLTITATDTGEVIFLPAGTYRQILQLPIDSPLFQSAEQTRKNQAPPVETKMPKSRYAEPEEKPVWVRYESLERIKIGDAERRGGIDIPSHGPKGLGPRVWYAKSEQADPASSVFYFVFGGLGYSAANLLGWSSGNTREISETFEYHLIRR